MLGLILIDGLNLGIQASSIIHLITKTDDKTHDDLLSGIAIMVFGVGTLFGGYIGGKLCDKLKVKKASIGGVIFFGISCSGIFIASFFNWYPLTLIAFLFFGFQYSYITCC